jgi:pimeloyl-ACP methyl ester carboxylesterase
MSAQSVEPELRRITSHGVELVAEAWGRSGDPGIVLMHGGGQTRHAFRRVARALAALGHWVLVPDLRGHGDSGWSLDGNYAIERFADDVRAWCALDGAPVTLVGASLGGLSSLLAAGEAPRLPLRGLALVDVAHRGEMPGVARILTFMRAHPEGFESFEHVVRAVAAYLPHRTPHRGGGRGLRHNLRERDGRLVWHWDPRLLERVDVNSNLQRSHQDRLLQAARAIQAPILLIRGGDSDLLSEEIADEFCREVPHAARVDVAGARHMVAGDQNDPFLEAILQFASRAA